MARRRGISDIIKRVTGGNELKGGRGRMRAEYRDLKDSERDLRDVERDLGSDERDVVGEDSELGEGWDGESLEDDVNVNDMGAQGVQGLEQGYEVSSFNELFDRLPIRDELLYRMGKEPLRTVAEWVQSRGYFVDVELGKLVSRLMEYKRAREREVTKEVAVRDHEDTYIKAVEQIDELYELGWLYVEQKKRIQERLQAERGVGDIDVDLKAEMALAVKLLKERHEIKMDLGIGLSKDEKDAGFKGFDKVADSDTRKVVGVLEDPESATRIHAVLTRLLGRLDNVENAVGSGSSGNIGSGKKQRTSAGGKSNKKDFDL